MSALLTFQDSTVSQPRFAQYYVRSGPLSRNKRKFGTGGAMAGYDDRDGFIWMDGELVEWRSANVHILTHALHYASSVFEGERCYNGKIFKSREHSERLRISGELLDMPLPYSVDEIEAAKEAVLKANGLTDAYVRALAWRGAGEDMGVASKRNPIRMAVACWSWGNYYGDAKMKGAKLDIAKWKRPAPKPSPRGQGGGALHDLHHVQARRRGEGLLGRDDAGLSRLCGRGDRGQHLLRQGWRGAYAQARRLPERHHPADVGMLRMLRDMQIKVHETATSCPRKSWKGSRAVLADRHRRRGCTPVGQIGAHLSATSPEVIGDVLPPCAWPANTNGWCGPDRPARGIGHRRIGILGTAPARRPAARHRPNCRWHTARCARSGRARCA
jgi:hypothetical protein